MAGVEPAGSYGSLWLRRRKGLRFATELTFLLLLFYSYSPSHLSLGHEATLSGKFTGGSSSHGVKAALGVKADRILSFSG